MFGNIIAIATSSAKLIAVSRRDPIGQTAVSTLRLIDTLRDVYDDHRLTEPERVLVCERAFALAIHVMQIIATGTGSLPAATVLADMAMGYIESAPIPDKDGMMDDLLLVAESRNGIRTVGSVLAKLVHDFPMISGIARLSSRWPGVTHA